ncbi:MAG: AraC family transcriptional regulator [Clostridiales bacterium]|nr:AraC family transcriptional regulator [Clostridiales bacterium]
MKPEQDQKYQEKKRHGSAYFPFNIYPCTIPGDFPSVALHWQNSMEIIYVKKGRGIVQLDTQLTEAAADDIFVVPPGTLHALKEYSGESMEYENIIFDLEFLGSTTADVCAAEYLVPLSAGQLFPGMQLRRRDGDSSGLFVTFSVSANDAMVHTTDSGYSSRFPSYSVLSSCLSRTEILCKECFRGYELGVKAAILEFLSLLIPLCPTALQKESVYTERLKTVISRVEQDYSHPLTVQEMADFCGCSSSHFMRWFRQMTGSSFGQYVNERRLAYAAELLRKSDDKIILIAEKAGFENLSNFNRQFKSRYGITPSGYRKKPRLF